MLKSLLLPRAKKSMCISSALFSLGTLPLPAIYLTDYAFYYHVNCFRLQEKKSINLLSVSHKIKKSISRSI